jgi:DNA-binding MarR family transcriptional regulator
MAESSHPFCRCLYYSANALARNITGLADMAFRRTGLAPSLGFVLISVIRKPGIQPSELADIMMLDPSTVTRMVEKLQGKGLVGREVQGRSTLITPTAAGRALMPDLEAALETLQADCRNHLGEEDLTALTAKVYEAALKLEEV